ncbi:TetR/AcrR family transcriptional regulator [Saccharothrix syringae]|uniref:TetR/AcrR family transcriptional regulator n=1 Tax=Saccharothrix syringae TaxID=103733 RepID=A0A5Q0HFG8_SACSY|nr:TetR/AcrR family transcriptional regulator [Saccharothrix syringae]
MLRSRAALLAAAVRLVSERGTSAVPVTDLAEAADVSRQLVYQHFGDRDALLVEAALDLVRHELLAPRDGAPGRLAVLAAVRHFADHRAFYRAVLSGPCAFALTRALGDLLAPVNRHVVRAAVGGGVRPDTLDDLAAFVTAGTGAVINAWLLSDRPHLDAEEFTDRLLRLWGGLGLTHHREDVDR